MDFLKSLFISERNASSSSTPRLVHRGIPPRGDSVIHLNDEEGNVYVYSNAVKDYTRPLLEFKYADYIRPPHSLLEESLPHQVTPVSQEFSRFLDLPLELRHKIWRHTLPGPQVRQIKHSFRHDFYYSNCPQPIALHICRESRDEAKRFYVTLSDALDGTHADGQPVMRFYFNPALDVLYLSNSCWHPGSLQYDGKPEGGFLNRVEGRLIRHIVIDFITVWLPQVEAGLENWLQLLRGRLSDEGSVLLMVKKPWGRRWTPCFSVRDIMEGERVAKYVKWSDSTRRMMIPEWHGPAIKCVVGTGCRNFNDPEHRCWNRPNVAAWELIREHEANSRVIGARRESWEIENRATSDSL